MILNKFRNLSVKIRILIILVLSVLAIFLIVYFIIIPRVNFIKEKGEEIVERRQFLEEQYIKAKKFREDNQDMQLVDEDIDKLDEVFVKYDNDLEFIETLEGVALENNIDQKISLNSTKSEEEKDFEKIRLEISAEGDFFNIMNYLIDLEILSYYININSLDIYKLGSQGINNQEDLPNLSKVFCKIIADTYWK